MNISLSDHFTYKKLLQFVMPSIIMMIVNSIYSIVDGLFVSNIVGKNAFAAVNLMMPVAMIVATIGFMIGTGGSALVGVKISFIFIAIFLGYSFGCAPLFSYNYGSQNKIEMKNLFKKSLILIFVSSIAMIIVSVSFANPVSKIFVGYDSELLKITIRGLAIYSISYIFTGFNIFASSFFTALKNGLVSGILSIARTMIFEVGAILVLPIFWEIDGIWAAIVVADFFPYCFL